MGVQIPIGCNRKTPPLPQIIKDVGCGRIACAQILVQRLVKLCRTDPTACDRRAKKRRKCYCLNGIYLWAASFLYEQRIAVPSGLARQIGQQLVAPILFLYPQLRRFDAEVLVDLFCDKITGSHGQIDRLRPIKGSRA